MGYNSCCNCDGLRTRAAISGGKWIEMVCFLVVKREGFLIMLGMEPSKFHIVLEGFFFFEASGRQQKDEKLKHLTNRRD